MAPRRRRLLLRLLPLLAAAGCVGAAGREEALREAMLSSQASLVAVGASPSSSLPPRDDAGALGRAEPPRAAAAARPRLAATGPVPRSASELVGLPPEALRQRLGEPDLRRIEGPAEIWLYAGAACALDLILYGERTGRGGPTAPRVAHAAARASGTEPRTEAACLAEIAGGGSRGPVIPAGATRG